APNRHAGSSCSLLFYIRRDSPDLVGRKSTPATVYKVAGLAGVFGSGGSIYKAKALETTE
ncbi:MAG: hypothetical protein ACLPX8_26160, partial [Bryobacteraceae bacterium]